MRIGLTRDIEKGCYKHAITNSKPHIIYIYICMYVCICICIYIYMYICVHPKSNPEASEAPATLPGEPRAPSATSQGTRWSWAKHWEATGHMVGAT